MALDTSSDAYEKVYDSSGLENQGKYYEGYVEKKEKFKVCVTVWQIMMHGFCGSCKVPICKVKHRLPWLIFVLQLITVTMFHLLAKAELPAGPKWNLSVCRIIVSPSPKHALHVLLVSHGSTLFLSLFSDKQFPCKLPKVDV